MANELEARIIELESRFLYMQKTIDELNLIVTEQQDALDRLLKQFGEISIQMKQAAVEIDPNEKPPHY